MFLQRLDDSFKGADSPSDRPLSRDEFITLFDDYYVPLVRFAQKYTTDVGAAGDVVQDVFLKLWERRQSIEIRTSAKAMLYTMVRNRSLSLRRDRQRVAGDVSVPDVAEEPPVELKTAGAELHRRLRQWIDDLPERRREAFMLSRFHDLSHAEIADIMNVSVRTVNTHILLALRSLRDRLEEYRRESEPD